MVLCSGVPISTVSSHEIDTMSIPWPFFLLGVGFDNFSLSGIQYCTQHWELATIFEVASRGGVLHQLWAGYWKGFCCCCFQFGWLCRQDGLQYPKALHVYMRGYSSYSSPNTWSQNSVWKRPQSIGFSSPSNFRLISRYGKVGVPITLINFGLIVLHISPSFHMSIVD